MMHSLLYKHYILGCVTAGQLFGWEFILSFILVSTVYACAIGAPNFGESAC